MLILIAVIIIDILNILVTKLRTELMPCLILHWLEVWTFKRNCDGLLNGDVDRRDHRDSSTQHGLCPWYNGLVNGVSVDCSIVNKANSHKSLAFGTMSIKKTQKCREFPGIFGSPRNVQKSEFYRSPRNVQKCTTVKNSSTWPTAMSRVHSEKRC